ncbi:MAG: hypothetical protein Q7S58_18065 [Candidatus Binatus sp.]|uniref:hypothetical protein n=1 Tax=Candidatus Binatus sp. TaxID=2811406 RepID=UPI002718B949|nr:hypothetical protein [Candidatus Binatus sp.]MDO8434310.1 hypothetical protein [Candidatus Binatus sp.]
MLVLALAGCRPRSQLTPHFLPGIVAGSEHIFRKVKIAVPPTASRVGSGRVEVGKIYAVDGAAESSLHIVDAGAMFTLMLRHALADAGLAPVAVDSIAPDGKPPAGADFILYSTLEQVEVNKRYGADETVHGQYFDMTAMVVAKFELRNRAGQVLYSGEVTGIEKEPPEPVGNEVFLPLETEPVESLSVALSRTLGGLMLEPKFRAALPLATPEPAQIR